MMQRRGNKSRRRGGKAAGAFEITNAGDQIVKRLTLTGQTLATGAGTVIPVTLIGTTTTSGVNQTGAAEWASFAARYQQYRVRAIRITGKAIQPVQTAALAHSDLFRGDFIGVSFPATAVQVYSDERVRTNTTNRDFTHVVTWKGIPDARLWNPTSAAIPLANGFGWACASPAAPPLTTATTYYALTIEWEVEFRGSQ